jgi:predicted transcriptional regulator of viral defense system
MTTKPSHGDLYRIAEAQAGYFSSRQARQAGFSYQLIRYHQETSQFLRVAHGTYRLAQFPASPLEDLFVAWLRCGPKSVISHESALAVHDLSDVIPSEIHVTVPRSASIRREGIRQHRNKLRSTEVTQRQGLPVTTVARTISDVAKAGLAEEHVGRAIQEALQRGLTTRKSLLAEAKRRGGRAAQLIRKQLGQ